LRARHGGIDKAEAQAGCDLIEMVAGKIATVIDVEHIGDAAYGVFCISPDKVYSSD
jgi:hypothetical protein